MNRTATLLTSVLTLSLAARATAQPPVPVPKPAPRPNTSPRLKVVIPRLDLDLPRIDSDLSRLDVDLSRIDVSGAIEAAEQALRDLDFAQTAAPKAPLAPLPPLPPKPPTFGDRAQGLYDQGRDAIERGRYEQAVERFDRLIEMKAKTTDAALYWKAYSLERLGDRAKALTALGDLQKQFSDSRWIKDAKALELELRQASGQSISPDAQNNEELKLLALRGLMQNDPDQALPIMEKMLNGSDTPRVKEQALFVLSQSRVARAREIIAGIAKGNANPDLQLKAIRYLGMLRASPELLAAYQSDPSVDVRKAIANTLFQQRDAATLVTLARAEKNPEMKRELVSKLSLIKSKEATDYLLELLK